MARNIKLLVYPVKDVEKAKALLATAGLKDTDNNGFLEYEGKEVVLSLLSPKGRYIKDTTGTGRKPL